eukprot:s3968_g2.t1
MFDFVVHGIAPAISHFGTLSISSCSSSSVEKTRTTAKCSCPACPPARLWTTAKAARTKASSVMATAKLAEQTAAKLTRAAFTI